jgi:hypothetical protein
MSADKTKYEIPLDPPYLTPMLNGDRVALRVSAEDAAKPRRGPGDYGVITDLDTGKRYTVRGRPCEVPTCYCDAEIIEIPGVTNAYDNSADLYAGIFGGKFGGGG